MKHLLIVAASLLLGHAAWSAPVAPTCVTVTTAAFKDYAAKDYRPTSGSPLIGKGRKNELADGTDLIGNRRAVGPMDIGCYEAAQGMMIYVR